MRSILELLRSKPEEMAIALGSYIAKNEKEVSFNKGDRLILKTSDGNWWKVIHVKDARIKGEAPSNYLVKLCDIDNFKWISFKVSKAKAETMLNHSDCSTGSFLIRLEDDRFYGSKYALKLTVKTENLNCFIHKMVSREGSNFRLQDSESFLFKSLEHLVDHYAGSNYIIPLNPLIHLLKKLLRRVGNKHQPWQQKILLCSQKIQARRKDPAFLLTFSFKKQLSVVPWEYLKTAVEKFERLGGGDFGVVYKGSLNGVIVALKTPKDMEEAEFLKEAEKVRFCKHPNVLETIGVWRNTERIYLITEFMENTSIKEYFKKHMLSATGCLSVSHKVALAMDYLHNMKVVHRDLAARNILVGATIDHIKVCDFGLASIVKEDESYYSEKYRLPFRWTAPEAFVLYKGIIPEKRGKITSAADVWSFGVVMWELYSNGEIPYEEIDSRVELLAFLTEENNRLERPCSVEKCPEVIYSKMHECWNIDRTQRPKFSDLSTFLYSLLTGEDAPQVPLRRISNSDTEEESNRGSSGIHRHTLNE